MPRKKINKSAKDGKIVTKEFADENPDTTFATEPKGIEPPNEEYPNPKIDDNHIALISADAQFELTPETIPTGAVSGGDVVDIMTKPKKDPASRLIYGEKYLFTGTSGSEFIGILNDTDTQYNTVTVHEVVNGVQSTRDIEVPDITVYKTRLLSKDEAFQRLAMAE